MSPQLRHRANGLGSDSSAVGTERQIDQLGRVVIPAKLRRMLGLHAGALVDFRFVDGCIAMTKIVRQCVLCGSRDHLSERRGKYICDACLHEIRDDAYLIT